MKIIITQQKKKTDPRFWTIVSDNVLAGTSGQSLIETSKFADTFIVGSFKKEIIASSIPRKNDNKLRPTIITKTKAYKHQSH
jgi:hypothetical protein